MSKLCPKYRWSLFPGHGVLANARQVANTKNVTIKQQPSLCTTNHLYALECSASPCHAACFQTWIFIQLGDANSHCKSENILLFCQQHQCHVTVQLVQHLILCQTACKYFRVTTSRPPPDNMKFPHISLMVRSTPAHVNRVTTLQTMWNSLMIPWRFAALFHGTQPVLVLLSVVGVGMQQYMIQNHILNI